MTRLSLATVLMAWLAAPWSGCDREPVTPPAAPPSERAPNDSTPPKALPLDGILLLPASRRFG